jgi:hypothetical protein
VGFFGRQIKFVQINKENSRRHILGTCAVGLKDFFFFLFVFEFRELFICHLF